MNYFAIFMIIISVAIGAMLLGWLGSAFIKAKSGATSGGGLKKNLLFTLLAIIIIVILISNYHLNN